MRWYVLKRGRLLSGPFRHGIQAYDAMYDEAEAGVSKNNAAAMNMDMIERRLSQLSIENHDSKRIPLELYAWRTLIDDKFDHFIAQYNTQLSELIEHAGEEPVWLVTHKFSQPATLLGAEAIEDVVGAIRDPQMTKYLTPLSDLMVFDLSLAVTSRLITRCLVRQPRRP